MLASITPFADFFEGPQGMVSKQNLACLLLW